MTPAPYPATTRANGWRFELDYEQIERSSTWALAGAEARPWLLMMWMQAWRQVPCGSMPAEHEVIAALLGMPPELWERHSRVLLRGWWLADDGRLYHNTIVARVGEMMRRRRADSDRQASKRARDAAAAAAPAAVPAPPPRPEPPDQSTGHPPNHADVTRDTAGTPGEVGSESSTDNRQPNTEDKELPPAVIPRAPEGGGSLAGRACIALRRAGIAGVNPQHPTLLALLSAGASQDELVAYAPMAKDKRDPFAYLLAAAVASRQRAAEQAKTLHQGPLPAAAADAGEPAWRREQRERNEAFLGPAAARWKSRQLTKPENS